MARSVQKMADMMEALVRAHTEAGGARKRAHADERFAEERRAVKMEVAEARAKTELAALGAPAPATRAPLITTSEVDGHLKVAREAEEKAHALLAKAKAARAQAGAPKAQASVPTATPWARNTNSAPVIEMRDLQEVHTLEYLKASEPRALDAWVQK